MPDQPEDHSSPTAQETLGVLGLGSTQGQRSAEMVAGLRAELMPSPETLALTRTAGRVIAGVLLRIARGDHAKINVVAARPAAFHHLITQELRDKPEAHFVELAAGFLPRGLQLARLLPSLKVTEIDLPNVISDKQQRLQKARLAMPPNIHWLSADLGVTPLSRVLEGQKADVIAAEGLLGYFPLDQVQLIAARVRESLKPDGVFIADIGTQEGIKLLSQGKTRQAINIFRRNVGQWPGLVRDGQHAQDIFRAAGYRHVETHALSALVADLPHVPKPVADVTLFVIARV